MLSILDIVFVGMYHFALYAYPADRQTATDMPRSSTALVETSQLVEKNVRQHLQHALEAIRDCGNETALDQVYR